MNMLKLWQQKHGLVADGVLGKLTTKSLMDFLSLSDKKSFLMFMAQVSHETMAYTKIRENLNYQPHSLIATFNTGDHKRFTLSTAQMYGRTAMHSADQVMIANIAYANRGGNGSARSGDGWKYRGGGALHTTFKNNWQAYFAYAGLPSDTDTSIVNDPDHFFMTGKFWMDSNHGWDYANDSSYQGVKQLSNLINAGNPHREADPNGLEDRLILTDSMLRHNGLA